MSRKIDLLMHNARMKVVRSLHPLRSLFLEITTICNLHCKHCYIPQAFARQVLPYELVGDILQEVKKGWGTSAGIALTGGEPLLHTDFQRIMSELHRHGFSWSLSTNGLLLTDLLIDELMAQGCNTISISLDGNNRAHDELRNHSGAGEKTVNAIESLIEKKFPYIIVTTTVCDDNSETIGEVYDFVSSHKGRVMWRINPLLYCDRVEKNGLKLSKKNFSELCDFVRTVENQGGDAVIFGEKNPLSLRYGEYFFSEFDSCQAGVSTFGVLANGDIVNCMVCRDEVRGNCTTDSLIKVWDEEELLHKGLCPRHIDSKCPRIDR